MVDDSLIGTVHRSFEHFTGRRAYASLPKSIGVSITLFALCPNKKIIDTRSQVIDVHTLFGDNLLGSFSLGISQFSLLVEGIKCDVLYLMRESIGKLHIHIVDELHLQMSLQQFLTSLIAIVPIIAGREQQAEDGAAREHHQPSLLFDITYNLLHYYFVINILTLLS